MTVPEQDYLTQMADEIVARVVAALGPRDDRQLLTLKEARDQMRISERSLYKITQEDKALEVVVVGDGSKRIRQAAIDEYLASRVDGG